MDKTNQSRDKHVVDSGNQSQCLSEALTGFISSMQHFSTGDGPGIRSTIFFQGCNLNCVWCHNPETIPLQPVLLFYAQRCTDCGLCSAVCPADAHKMEDGRHVYVRDACRQCGHCVQQCPSDALCLSGLEMTAREVLDFIFEDIDFYRASGGGVTLSGGEPLLQADFCAHIALNCKLKGVPVIIDTAGHVNYAAFEKLMPYTEHFYFDLKGPDPEAYTEKTGGSLSRSLENLSRLVADGAGVTARIPIIPGYNDGKDDCLRLRELLIRTDVKSVHLLPYHRLGSSKYSAMGKPEYMRGVRPSPDKKLRELLTVFSSSFLAKIET